MGRPSKRTPELVEKIIEGISDGTPLAVICREEGIGVQTVTDWKKDDEELSVTIAHARETGADMIAHRTRETARGRGESTGNVLRDRLIIETDLKLLAKWDPKRYGDRISQEISGPDGGPIKTETAIVTDQEREDYAAMIKEAIGKRE